MPRKKLGYKPDAVENPVSSRPQCRTAVSDCMARRRANATCRSSEAKFFLLFDQAPLGYQSLDEEGRILEVNQTWLDLMGYPREEVLGRWFGAFLQPDHQDLFRERFSRFKAEGVATGVEWEIIRKDAPTPWPAKHPPPRRRPCLLRRAGAG